MSAAVVLSPHCPQPGCPGHIEGGFCDACGLEAALAPPGTTVTSPATAVSTSTGTSRGTGRSRSRTRGAGHSSTRRQSLGLGLVRVPELPPLDPASVLMAEPVVPEGKRFCPHCEEKLRREQGFCPKCGKPYSFLATLKAGDVVAEQYEILGPMAFGGLGWIYLGKDRSLGRYVVLKGLLNAQDASAAAAAVAERQFLAAVKHPNIVGVYTFVQRGAEGYIVMEFVRGRTLKAIRKERGPLPPAEAIAYLHRILGAFAYLHRQTPPLIYCDFKPENVMLEGDDVKLIDLGAVRREDDIGGDVYGTKGYSAPEGGTEPGVSSDLFTVARTLAVLVTEFRGFQGTYEFTLPPPAEEPLYARHESLYRWLTKATRREPEARFNHAEEMAEQLAGVLREIVAAETGTPRPAESTLFTGDALHSAADDHDAAPPAGPAAARRLPGLKLDPADPAAALLLANATATDPTAAFAQAAARFPDSLEARLRLARAHAEAGRMAESDAALAEAAILAGGGANWRGDWRLEWQHGLSELARSQAAAAVPFFDAAYSELPGELAPKLALALACELARDFPRAARYYDVVSRTDPGFLSAVFGLARCQRALGRRDEAARALGRVPATSGAYTRAQVSLARTQLLADTADELSRAARTIEALTLDHQERHRLSAEILHRALGLLDGRQLAAAPDVRLFNHPLEDAGLRRGLENALRSLARLATDRAEKIRLVDLANRLRPRTWV